MLSSSLIDHLPQHRVWAYPAAISDHYPVILEWRESTTHCVFPFKFNHSWLAFDDFINMIKNEWSLLSKDSTVSMDTLSLKLRLLKAKIKAWTFHKSLEIKDKSIVIEKEIHILLTSSHSSILSSESLSSLKALQQDLKKLKDHEILSAKLKSRMIWASLGDSNTKFFHSVASARKNHNTIWGLENEEGTVVESDQELKDMGVRHFKIIFSDDNQTTIFAQLNVIKLYPSYFSPEERSNFNSKVTLLEIERALKYFNKDKSPGPDGSPVEFYLSFFDLLRNDLLLLVEESRLTGKVMPSINSTFIILIPKKRKSYHLC